MVSLCRVRKDIGDPRQFVLAVAYVLNAYPEWIIQNVTDPRTGLPGRLKYPLEIADVERACCAEKATKMLLRPPPSPSTPDWECEAKRAREEKLAQRRRYGPPWLDVIALIKQKTTGVTHNRAEQLFKLRSFEAGVLTIVAPTEIPARILDYSIKERFPEVTEVRFVETTEVAA